MSFIKTKTVAAVALLSSFAFAESGESISVYSGGVRLGTAVAVNSELSDSVSSTFIKVGHSSYWKMNDNFQVNLDLDWLGTGTNFAVSVGTDYHFVTGKVRPYIGAGAGAAYFDHDDEIGTGFGPSLKVQAGLALDLADNFGMIINLPYQFIANSTNDQVVGLDLTFCWFGKYKNIKRI